METNTIKINTHKVLTFGIMVVAIMMVAIGALMCYQDYLESQAPQQQQVEKPVQSPIPVNTVPATETKVALQKKLPSSKVKMASLQPMVVASENSTYQKIIAGIQEQCIRDKKALIIVTNDDLRVLQSVGKQEKVNWLILVSQWYQESRCGANMGKYSPLEVLSNNAKEHKAFLSICRNLRLDPSSVKSGGAGELGHLQIKPSIWLYINGNNKKANPWNLTDAANAAAKFLKSDGGYGDHKVTPHDALSYYNGGHKGNEEYAKEVVDRIKFDWRIPNSI